MRNIRALGVLTLALVLGLAAAAYAANWLQQQGAEGTVQVLVAKRDLQMGTRLQPDMLETVRWPKAALTRCTKCPSWHAALARWATPSSGPPKTAT